LKIFFNEHFFPNDEGITREGVEDYKTFLGNIHTCPFSLTQQRASSVMDCRN